MSDEHNGVFWTQEKRWFWRIDETEKGPFASVIDCAKDYCTSLVDHFPQYREIFNGKTWHEIWDAAGLSMQAKAAIDRV